MDASTQARSELAGRLRARRAEIEQAVLTRILAIDAGEISNPEYGEGLRATISASVEYTVEVIEMDEELPPPIPGELRRQARMAATHGVALDTVLRRYLAGLTVLGDFILREVEDDGSLRAVLIHRLAQEQATHFDQIAAAVSVEHARAREQQFLSSEQRQARRVERLLAGESSRATANIKYELDKWHVGAVAVGESAAPSLRELARRLDHGLLLVERPEGTVWAWFGSARKGEPANIERVASSTLPPGLTLALGEPGKGASGWRFTHRQALAALRIASRSEQRVVRYARCALVAGLLQDDLLGNSLRQLYLEPLESERDGGAALRQTLMSYFVADRNMSSAAAALGVNRRTVANHLQAIEQLWGRPMRECAMEAEAALRLADLDGEV